MFVPSRLRGRYIFSFRHNCSQPCPVNAYTTEEYTVMWLVTAIVSTIGLILNIYMAVTW